MEAALLEGWRASRDRKLMKMLDPDEPAWLMEEDVQVAKEEVYYTVVHRWMPGGWARRHYTYDMVSDVIHFRGTTPLDDSDILKMKPDQRILHHKKR
ncbi:MAG: hypothetical protein H0T73_11305 [Ardenticatenales bacterium]|nr:hypothetical protein [Ardenticatenales bacterium]